MAFSRQEYWSGLPFPSPGDLPDPGIEPGSPAFQEDTLTSEPPGKGTNSIMGFPGSSVGKESACRAGDTRDAGSIPGSGRSPGVGNGSYLENSMDRRDW